MNLDATPKSKWIGEPDYDFAVKDKDAGTSFSVRHRCTPQVRLINMKDAVNRSEHYLADKERGICRLPCKVTILQLHPFIQTQANTGVKYVTQYNYLFRGAL